VDVARTIGFLASGDAHHITGQDLLVDGGHSIAGNLANIPGISRPDYE
jgi:NAD(P)-dependent dehydrogenase (short-subunit alcohol dehydrogenase family)